MESKLDLAYKESKSYKKGKATAKLWKAELDTRGKVLAKINEVRKAYKDYLLDCYLLQLQRNPIVKENEDFYLGSMDEMRSWL